MGPLDPLDPLGLGPSCAGSLRASPCPLAGAHAATRLAAASLHVADEAALFGASANGIRPVSARHQGDTPPRRHAEESAVLHADRAKLSAPAVSASAPALAVMALMPFAGPSAAVVFRPASLALCREAASALRGGMACRRICRAKGFGRPGAGKADGVRTSFRSWLPALSAVLRDDDRSASGIAPRAVESAFGKADQTARGTGAGVLDQDKAPCRAGVAGKAAESRHPERLGDDSGLEQGGIAAGRLRAVLPCGGRRPVRLARLACVAGAGWLGVRRDLCAGRLGIGNAGLARVLFGV